MNALCHVYGWVMSHTSMRRVIHMDGYCHIPQCVWMSLVTYINESCHTFDPSMSHTSMHHVINNKWWCHIHPWIMSHIWLCTWTRRLTCFNEYDRVMSRTSMIHMNGSCHIHQWRTLHTELRHVIMYVDVCDMTHSCVSLMCVTWLGHTRYIQNCVTLYLYMSTYVWEGGWVVGVSALSQITLTHTCIYTQVANDEYFYCFKT